MGARRGPGLTVHLLVDGRALTRHATLADAGRELARLWTRGPTPWSAKLYGAGGGAASPAEARAALAAAADMIRGGLFAAGDTRGDDGGD